MSNIAKYISTIQKLKVESNEAKAMLDDALENNSEYRELAETKKNSARECAIVKEQILNEPGNAELEKKLKDLRQEMSEEKELLSQELAVHLAKEGKSEITLPDGTTYTFKLSATLQAKN